MSEWFRKQTLTLFIPYIFDLFYHNIRGLWPCGLCKLFKEAPNKIDIFITVNKVASIQTVLLQAWTSDPLTTALKHLALALTVLISWPLSALHPVEQLYSYKKAVFGLHTYKFKSILCLVWLSKFAVICWFQLLTHRWKKLLTLAHKLKEMSHKMQVAWR